MLIFKILLNMKKIYLLFIVLLSIASGWSQNQTITVGTGTSTQVYPLGNYYGYERSASLYTSGEILYSGNILSLAWQAATGSIRRKERGVRPAAFRSQARAETRRRKRAVAG